MQHFVGFAHQIDLASMICYTRMNYVRVLPVVTYHLVPLRRFNDERRRRMHTGGKRSSVFDSEFNFFEQLLVCLRKCL